MTESWRQAVLTIPDYDSDRVQHLLLDLGALGLQIQDDESLEIPERPFTPQHIAVVTGTFDKSPELEAQISEAFPEYEIHFQDLIDGDWENEFIRTWRAFTVGENIWVVPSWDADFIAPKGALVLKMDPGMAFGTGHHETTTLCAHAVREAVETGRKQVLDVGTGTGILAMIAAKSGAIKIVGTDNDPLALRVAEENLGKNDLAFELTLKTPDQFGPQFDLVVANILANPLIELAPQMVQAMTSGGLLLLSGILNSQALGVQQAYENLGLTHLATKHLGDWVLISLSNSNI
ncbi:MAG: 50S ribosomal protein L11 methyltransferase [Myxococcota bacterium]